MQVMPKRLVIVGAGGHGRVVHEICSSLGLVVYGFVDSGIKCGDVVMKGIYNLGNENLLTDDSFISEFGFVVAISDQSSRRRLCTTILNHNGSLATLIHPSCIVSGSCTVGVGTVMVAGSIVNADTMIGRFCIVNTGATIDHDCRLLDGVQISPGVHLAGGVRCEDDSFIGIGAAVVPGVSVGARTIVGAGSVVLHDLPADVVAFGTPARINRRRS
jgi:sugar O-acyltransferase (sialic acid O-acetyltransferase NeuD family)